MKKILIFIITAFIAFSFCGCTKTTEFDDKEISKIETLYTEGFFAFHCEYTRTFDFKTGEVTDTKVADLSNYPQEYFPDINFDTYNKPSLVCKFSEQQADEFISIVKSLGFYSWGESYVTDDVVNDAGHNNVTIWFSDGTRKSTHIYFKYPPKYNEISAAFEECLGAKLYFE